MTRIRYKKEGELLVSTRPILVGERFVTVAINSDGSFNITNADANLMVFTEGSKTTIANAKKAVKTKLVELGATFQAEVRPRVNETVAMETEEDEVHA